MPFTRTLLQVAGLVSALCFLMILSALIMSPLVPSSGVLAYVNYPPGSLSGTLYVLDFMRAISIPFVENIPVAVQPDLSPDGRWLGFDGFYGGNYDLYLVDLAVPYPDMEQPVRLTDNELIDGNLTWSPDGTQILFTSVREQPDLYILDLNDHTERQITNDQWFENTPIWSPDGQRIAYQSNRQSRISVYVLDLTTGEERRVVDTLDVIGDMAWLPDNQQIAYILRSRVSGMDVVNLETGEHRIIASDAGFIRSFVWSPDGQFVAHTVSDPSGEVGIYVMNADGSDVRRIPHLPGFDLYPTWLPWSIIYSEQEILR